jgi:excisionase family DNA binding protein
LSQTHTVTSDVDPWLTISQCAQRTQCDERTIRRLANAGILRSARIGIGRKSIRIRASWLDAAMEATATPIEVSR